MKTKLTAVTSRLFWWQDVLDVVVNVESDTSRFINCHHNSTYSVPSLFFSYGQSTPNVLVKLPYDLKTTVSTAFALHVPPKFRNFALTKFFLMYCQMPPNI